MNSRMPACLNHAVDRLSNEQLKDVLFRVDTNGFPADLEAVWTVEQGRFRETLRRIPPPHGPRAALLDLGSSRAWLPFFQIVLGYRRIVLNTCYPESGFVSEVLPVRGAERADVRMSVFDVERDSFPHEDESFDVVLCLEVLEHLVVDPMGMMAEVNRVLKPGGIFVLTTPNAVRTANLVNALLGQHPLGWAPYNGFDTNRHNREYTPAEIAHLCRAAGLEPSDVLTFGAKNRGPVRRLLKWLFIPLLLSMRNCPLRWRNDVILAVGRKVSGVVDRRPSWLYFDMAERAIQTRPTIGAGSG